MEISVQSHGKVFNLRLDLFLNTDRSFRFIQHVNLGFIYSHVDKRIRRSLDSYHFMFVCAVMFQQLCLSIDADSCKRNIEHWFDSIGIDST